METMLVTRRERFLLETIRKVLYGSVEAAIRAGRIRTVKKIVETFDLDKGVDNRRS